MKNFKRSLALVLALVMIVGAFASVSAFTLTNQQAWFADAVYDLQNWGIITEGDVDSAMSNKTIDRKTFTLWVAKILSQDVDGKIWEKGVETRYEDVNYGEDNDDNSYAIAYATANGIVKGYNEGPNYQFGPDDALKLGQGAVIVIRLLSRFGDQGLYYSTTYLKNVQAFKNTFDTTEYAAYMWWAQQEDVSVIDDVYKANCTSFADGAELTYGEAAYLLWNAASNVKTSAEFDKGDAGEAGKIAEKLNSLKVNVNRTYYGIVTNVTPNDTYGDRADSVSIQVQTSSKTYVIMNFSSEALTAELPTRSTDNVGNVNNYTNYSSSNRKETKYVSIRDFTVGTMVKISYNGNAYNDSTSGVINYTVADAKLLKVEKLESNTVLVDTFLVYTYGYAYNNNRGEIYNHLYNELVFTNTSSKQRLNYTPTLAAYYDEVLAISKSTETRKNSSNADTTVYKINFLETNYVLGTIDAATGKIMLGAGLEASVSDRVIIACDATGTEVTVANIATVYNNILNIAEGQMKVTFADTDGDGDYDIITQNKDAVAFKTLGTKLDASGKEVVDYTTAGFKTDAASANTLTSNFLFNKSVLRVGETVGGEKIINTTKAAYSILKATNNGLTMLLMNPNEATPYYKQVALVDNVSGKTPTVVTGMVTNVETLGGIANYYKMTITAADGTTTDVTIPAYSALVKADGSKVAINKTFKYEVGSSSSIVAVDINGAGWYNYLITGYQNQYSDGTTADHFPATEANKPVWLLQRTVSVAVDVNNNVLTISGYDLLDSATETEGFVTRVEAGANANQFRVTLAGAKATTTVDVIASLSGAYDNATLQLINKIFYQKVFAGNEATYVGYVASPTNVLYVEVKNDTNNYIVAGTEFNNWKGASINGDITNRIFDAVTTYGTAYTNQTAAKVPTVAVPEVVNYYNAYTAFGYTWAVVAYPQYDTNGNLVSTQYAYVKSPAAINQVKYSQVSKLVIDFTKSYTLQVVYDGSTFATGSTKVVAPFKVYSTTVNTVTGLYEEIATPTYAQIYAYQTHKYYNNGVLDTTMGYGLFYTDANGYIGNLNTGCTNTRYFVDANNTVYTIVDYKGLVYQTKADGTYVIETLDAEAVATTDVTVDALAGNLTDLTPSYIASALPSNTEFSAHAKDQGYKYVPGWYRFDVLTDASDALNVKDDTVVIIATPSEARVGGLDKLNYTYTETTFGALRASGKELSVAAYDYYLDAAKGYVTYLVVFGAVATAGKNSEAIVTPSTPNEVVVDTTKAVVYLPASSITTAYVKTGDDVYYVESSYQAINVATGEKVGTLKYYYSTWNYGADYVHQATNNVTIAGGHFYLIDLSNRNAILADLGSVWTAATVERGGLVSGQFTFTHNGKTYSYNKNAVDGVQQFPYYMDNFTYTVSDMNNNSYSYSSDLLAEGTALGYFGTMTITDVTPSSIIATVDAKTGVDITDLSFRFVYFDYLGNNLYNAEEQNVAVDLPANVFDVIYNAEGYTSAEFLDEFKTFFGNSYYNLASDTQATNWLAFRVEKAPAIGYVAAVANYTAMLTSGASLSDIEEAYDLVVKAEASLASFEAKYTAAQNDIFWSSDVSNSKLYQYKIAQITSGKTVKYPTFTYYFDYATSTYTVFVTSFAN